MRLHFPNKEHADVIVAPGETTLGSAADNNVVVPGAAVAPHHISLAVSERSIVLAVRDAQARVHVNARPVREKALLRLGDVVSLDTIQFVLKPDRDEAIRTKLPAPGSGMPTPPPPIAGEDLNATRARQAPAKVVLRGVSGSYFGKIVPVRGRLTIGRGSDCDLVLDEPEMSRRHAVIENSGDGIYLRDLGSANGTFVNGVQVRDAVLHPDDQIAFDQNRFLLEAPSLPTRADGAEIAVDPDDSTITQTMRAVPRPNLPPPKPASEDRNKNDIWWLIGAAALIAVGIAVLFYVF